MSQYLKAVPHWQRKLSEARNNTERKHAKKMLAYLSEMRFVELYNAPRHTDKTYTIGGNQYAVKYQLRNRRGIS